ncbi:MAG TPA: hypothetical protein VKE70_06875 [Candidatus Solibacter sp.]|nr:hypothetical protein [Candidatus Solibacter sp.]
MSEAPPDTPFVLGAAAAWVSWHFAVLIIDQSADATLVRLELSRR